MISFILNVIQTTDWREMQDSEHWYLEPLPHLLWRGNDQRNTMCYNLRDWSGPDQMITFRITDYLGFPFACNWLKTTPN